MCASATLCNTLSQRGAIFPPTASKMRQEVEQPRGYISVKDGAPELARRTPRSLFQISCFSESRKAHP